jgi:hypothetical protein
MPRSAISLGFHCVSQQTILVLHDGSLNAFAIIARIWRDSRIWGVLDRMFIPGSARWRTDHT